MDSTAETQTSTGAQEGTTPRNVLCFCWKARLSIIFFDHSFLIIYRIVDFEK
jgi:hypothetical protein